MCAASCFETSPAQFGTDRELCEEAADTGGCIQIACLEFTIHMQTLTLAMFNKAGTVLVLIGAACD